jgi:hypothetical protein
MNIASFHSCRYVERDGQHSTAAASFLFSQRIKRKSSKGKSSIVRISNQVPMQHCCSTYICSRFRRVVLGIAYSFSSWLLVDIMSLQKSAAEANVRSTIKVDPAVGALEAICTTRPCVFFFRLAAG